MADAGGVFFGDLGGVPHPLPDLRQRLKVFLETLILDVKRSKRLLNRRGNFGLGTLWNIEFIFEDRLKLEREV